MADSASLTPTPPAVPPARRVRLVLVALVLLAALLRLWHVDAYLPHPLHSDYVQAEQAVDLLRQGWFADESIYPAAQVYLYAATDVVAYAVGRLIGDADAASWPAWLDSLADPTRHHALGRIYGGLLGALLPLAVYLLARVTLDRRAALLAAAMVAVAPLLVLHAHQVRPHVPVTTLLVFAAVPWLQVVLHDHGATPRRALLAGVGAGAVAALFQLGLLLAGAALVSMLLLVRPWRRALTLAAVYAVTFTATLALLDGLARNPAWVRALPTSAAEDNSSLGLLTKLLELGFLQRFFAELPDVALSWFSAAPAAFAFALLGLGMLTRRRGPLRARDAVAYLIFPAVIVVVMGMLLGAKVRYAVAVLPFVAPLAAAAALSLRPRAVATSAAVVLVLLPLAGSMRYLSLLDSADTRFSAAALAAALATPEHPVALEDRLVVDRTRFKHGVREFPPYGDLAQWSQGPFDPRRALRDGGAEVFMRSTGARWSRTQLDAMNLHALGFRPYGTLAGGPVGRLFLPDCPDRLALDLWRASRCGPPIEIWVSTPRAWAGLERLASPEELDAFRPPASLPASMSPAPMSATPLSATPLSATRLSATPLSATPLSPDAATGRPAPPPAFGGLRLAILDVDGDGATERVLGRFAAEQLSVFLALPDDAWTDLGDALPGADGRAPTLRGRGRLVFDEPLLILLGDAPADTTATLIIGAEIARAPFRGGRLVPAPLAFVPALPTGPDGHLALAALAPGGVPVGFQLVLQAWIRDPGGPAGFIASNAVAVTASD